MSLVNSYLAELTKHKYHSELGLAPLRAYLVRKHLNCFGGQVGALFSNIGCATGCASS